MDDFYDYLSIQLEEEGEEEEEVREASPRISRMLIEESYITPVASATKRL